MSQQRVWRGVYWTLGSALQFKADPPCRVVCKLTESCSRFPVCTASLYPQLNIFQSELVGLRQTYRCIMGNMDILWAVNLTSALATSIEACLSADVPTWPKTLPWLLTTGKEQKHYSTAPRFFSAQALQVYTGGGPGLQSRLCAQAIKYLQQFRYYASEKYSSERHVEKEEESSNNCH